MQRQSGAPSRPSWTQSTASPAPSLSAAAMFAASRISSAMIKTRMKIESLVSREAPVEDEVDRDGSAVAAGAERENPFVVGEKVNVEDGGGQ